MPSLLSRVREARSNIESPYLTVGYDTGDFSEATADTEMQLRLEDIGWTRLNAIGGRDANDLKQADRDGLVKRARLYFQQDAICGRGIKIYTAYAIGNGFSLKARQKDKTSQANETDTMVQKMADAFWKHPRNRKVFSIQGQEESSNQLLTDGEIFFAFFPPAVDGDVTHVRRLPDCLEIRAIITNPEDYQEVWYYHRTYTPVGGKLTNVLYPDQSLRMLYPDGSYPQPDDAMMKAFGVPTNTRIDYTTFVYQVKYGSTGMRGFPLITAAMGWSKAHKEFLEDRVAINRALARFSWMRKVKGAAASVMKLGANQPNAGSDVTKLPWNQPAGGIMTTNQAVDWSPVNAQSGGGSAAVESRVLRLMACIAMGLPEHYLADGSNGNKATATVMERPVQLIFQGYQNLWKEAYEAMFAFEMSEQGYEYDQDIVDVTAPAILENDSVALATAIVQLAQAMPEIKVTAFYARALDSLNIEDTQDILPEIEKRADTLATQMGSIDTSQGLPPTNPKRPNGAASTGSGTGS